MKQYHIRIDFDLQIEPRTPFESTSEQIKIRQAETYLKYNVHKLIKALEEKLNAEFNRDQSADYGIKPISLMKV